MALAKYLRTKREDKGLSQRQLSVLSGVSNSEISRIETGTRKNTSPEVLRALAEPLGVSYEDLMVKAGYLSDGIGSSPMTFRDKSRDARDARIRQGGSAVPTSSTAKDLEAGSEGWLHRLPKEIRDFLKNEASCGWQYLKLAHRLKQKDLEPVEVEAIVEIWVHAKNCHERKTSP